MKRGIKMRWLLVSVLNLAMLGAAVAVSFAWFINNGDATVRTDDNMLITAGSRLEIQPMDVDGEVPWASEISTKIETTIPDITGDGIHFYFPTTLNGSDLPFYDEPSSFLYVNESENKDIFYITVRLKFRTGVPMDVYLSDTSFVTGVDMSAKDDLTKTVPSGAIAGAVRIGFYEVTEVDGETVETLKAIWIPNEGYQLTFVPPNKYEFTENGEVETYGYLYPVIDEQTGETVRMEYRTWADGEVMIGTGDLAAAAGETTMPSANGSKPLLHFDCENGREEKQLTIRIWIEGTDREAVSTLNGGLIKYNLNFIGIASAD